MGTASGPVRAARFGPFAVDFRAGELLKQGRKVRLQEQPLQVLALLLERPGEVVTRDELQQKLWPGDTFVDFDHGLNNAINRLREALNDSAENPRYIETLPRRGYRFIAEVEREPGAVEPSPVPGVTSTEAAMKPIPVPRRRPPVLALAAAFLALLGALVVALNVGGWRDRLSASTSPPRIRSLAVLPLANLTGDESQEYFVDGMTDALTTNLAQIGALRVISRTSAMQYKGQNKSMAQIRRELNVDAVVEGSVVRSGNRVRINAQLIYAPGDRHLWAKSYEADLHDVLTLQNNVARAIADEIRIAVSPEEKARLGSRRPVGPEAYEALLRGRYSCAKRTETSMKKGIEYLEQAIALEPGYAQAYAELSDCYRLIQFFGAAPPEEFWPKAKAAAEKALELDDSLAEAHTSLAVLLWRHDWNWTKSETEFRRALQLNPNYAEAHRTYAVYLRMMGRFEEAFAEMKRAQELDPLSATLSSDVALLSFHWGKYNQAIQEGRKVLEIEPNHAQTHFVLGRAYTQMGNFPQAVRELEKAIELSGGNPAYVAALGCTYAAAGDRKRARQVLEELKQTSRKRYVPPYSLATIYAGLGEKDAAFANLEKAYAERSFLLPVLHLDPQLHSLRLDPRFQDLVRRIGLNPLQPVPRYNPASPR
jgi:TolB-like protein/DNA-binding winged helix-turn-helix (wHTH) protein/Flp pilus assembly protein TadD